MSFVYIARRVLWRTNRGESLAVPIDDFWYEKIRGCSYEGGKTGCPIGQCSTGQLHRLILRSSNGRGRKQRSVTCQSAKHAN